MPGIAGIYYLDGREAERHILAFSLPASLKIRDGWTKWILRQAMEKLLPEEVRLRKDKIPFEIPIRSWLWVNRDNIMELFSSDSVLSSQFINPAYIRENIDMLLRYPRTTLEVWRYINLELWLRAFFSITSNRQIA
ncbi:asparagine synthase-related protein [Chloroflexota bacterium]